MKKISQDKHKELLNYLKPLIKFMDDNGYSYLFVVGKDGKCARYLNGTAYEISKMLGDMAKKHEFVKEILNDSLA